MRRKKTYEPRCPAVRCGACAAYLGKVRAEHVKMPAEILARKFEGEVIYHCNYCKLVWFQPSDAPPGLGPRPVGYYDDPHVCPARFLSISKPVDVWPESRKYLPA